MTNFNLDTLILLVLIVGVFAAFRWLDRQKVVELQEELAEQRQRYEQRIQELERRVDFLVDQLQKAGIRIRDLENQTQLANQPTNQPPFPGKQTHPSSLSCSSVAKMPPCVIVIVSPYAALALASNGSTMPASARSMKSCAGAAKMARCTLGSISPPMPRLMASNWQTALLMLLGGMSAFRVSMLSSWPLAKRPPLLMPWPAWSRLSFLSMKTLATGTLLTLPMRFGGA